MSRKAAVAVATKPAPKAKAKQAPKAQPAPKRKPAPVVIESEPEETEVHHALTGIATRSRSTADGSLPPKHQIFEAWLRNPIQARSDAEKLATKFGLKTSTVKSWFSNWSLGLDGGGYYPHTLLGREKELTAALIKIAKAKKVG